MIFCSNHPQRAANNLCLQCGKWYCNECMAAVVPMPVCKTCSGRVQKPSAPHRAGRGVLQREQLGLPSFATKKAFHVALLALNAFLAGLAVFMQLNYDMGFFYLPLALSVLGHVPIKFLFKEGTKTAYPKRGSISEAQLETMLRLAEGKVTAKRLASATGTDEKTAEDFLKMRVLENKLSVGTNDTELVYTKTNQIP